MGATAGLVLEEQLGIPSCLEVEGGAGRSRPGSPASQEAETAEPLSPRASGAGVGGDSGVWLPGAGGWVGTLWGALTTSGEACRESTGSRQLGAV